MAKDISEIVDLKGETMNKIFIIGNATNAPETRATNNGTTVTTFTVAASRRFRNTNGDKETDFYRVSAWRQLGEVCGKYITKGSKVAVVGELQPRQYQGKDGQTRFSLELSADEVEFMSEKKPDQKPVNEWQDISTSDLPWEK